MPKTKSTTPKVPAPTDASVAAAETRPKRRACTRTPVETKVLTQVVPDGGTFSFNSTPKTPVSSTVAKRVRVFLDSSQTIPSDTTTEFYEPGPSFYQNNPSLTQPGLTSSPSSLTNNRWPNFSKIDFQFPATIESHVQACNPDNQLACIGHYITIISLKLRNWSPQFRENQPAALDDFLKALNKPYVQPKLITDIFLKDSHTLINIFTPILVGVPDNFLLHDKEWSEYFRNVAAIILSEYGTIWATNKYKSGHYTPEKLKLAYREAIFAADSVAPPKGWPTLRFPDKWTEGSPHVTLHHILKKQPFKNRVTYHNIDEMVKNKVIINLLATQTKDDPKAAILSNSVNIDTMTAALKTDTKANQEIMKIYQEKAENTEKEAEHMVEYWTEKADIINEYAKQANFWVSIGKLLQEAQRALKISIDQEIEQQSSTTKNLPISTVTFSENFRTLAYLRYFIRATLEKDDKEGEEEEKEKLQPTRNDDNEKAKARKDHFPPYAPVPSAS
ncbi:hypothetical protein TWF481_002856 [Arthrobotrys musiformis]|uniref:Uncharacterized protein n=1 Tax=Arthrobotrys musiformis TaxID=47236 RepID=A0AAV9VRK5_9PEZI